jgi:hypothetical protein
VGENLLLMRFPGAEGGLEGVHRILQRHLSLVGRYLYRGIYFVARA